MVLEANKKLKYLSVLIGVLFVTCISGALYYANAAAFDNKTQYQTAEKFYEQGNYQEAYVGFLRIKYFSKYHKISLLKQAMAAEKLGDWTIAETKYKQFARKYHGTTFGAKAEYSLAKAYYMNKKYSKAKQAFLIIKSHSQVENYRIAADYFLGKIALAKGDTNDTKKHYFDYLKEAPNGTYALTIAYDVKDMVLSPDEIAMISKIFLANQKYDEALVLLKPAPKPKTWTYLAMTYYYKGDYDNFKKTVSQGYSSMVSSILPEDMKDFTDFYLSLQQDKKKAIEDLQKSGMNGVLPDYLLYRYADLQPDNKKIEIYKDIVRKYPKSEYIPDCLVAIFFDFKNNSNTHNAIKVGKIYVEKFSGTPQESQMLFWTGKCLKKLGKNAEANKYFNKVISKYPDSYYAFRASRSDMKTQISWNFASAPLPDADKFDIEFPFDNLSNADISLIKLFLSVGDFAVLDEMPFDNYAIRSWIEYKEGNSAKSIYLANKYITEQTDKKPPYSSSVWKLAFPIYYSDYINENSSKRAIDPYLIISLIREESHFRENAISSSNAMGLMQLMIPTAIYIADKYKMPTPDESKIFDAQYNITLGTAYLSFVLDETGVQTPMYAIGGYNGGPNAMNKWKKTLKADDTDDFLEKIPYGESKNYIKKVFRSRYNYSKIYGR